MAQTDRNGAFSDPPTPPEAVEVALAACLAAQAAAEAAQAAAEAAVIAPVAATTHAATSKATPVDADELPLIDSAAAWVLKKLTWANLKATLLSGATFTGLVNLNAGSDIASASTVDLTAATGNTLTITGTVAITAFTMTAGQQMELIAAGALPLTYHATTMNINGGVSYTCAAGDRLFVNKAADNVVRVNVVKQDGTAVQAAYLTATEYKTGTDTTKILNAAIARENNLVVDTAVATTSGTNKDFIDIPAWVKRITILLAEFSTNGSSLPIIQIGDSGGFEISDYKGSSESAGVAAAMSTGFLVVRSWSSTASVSGILTLILLDSSTNTWAYSGITASTVAAAIGGISAGSKALSAPLDRLRLIATNGTDSFDAGTINVIYE